MQRRSQRKSGFSLVEMTVTVAIIGLLAAIIVTGADMLHTARLNRIITDMSKFLSAIEAFQEKYHDLPGDMPNAEDFWTTYNLISNPTGTVNGNGNGRIDNPNEDLRSWQHLVKADMIPGNYTGVAGSGDRAVIGTNLPEAALSGAGYRLIYQSNIYTISGNSFEIGGVNSLDSGNLNNSILTVENADVIDTKADDGDPDTGSIFITRGWEIWNTASRCVDDAYTASSASFVYTDQLVSCRMVYWINKE